MLGFIKKDFALMKNNFMLLVILLVFYIAMGISGEIDISIILPFISVLVMISTFSYDDFNHWNAYASCLPDGRKNCVKAKYVATILLIFLVTTITMVLSILLSSLHTKNIDYTYILYTMVGEIFGTILVLSIMYPIIYKFGIERARIIIFIMVFGIGILGGFLLNFIDVANILNLFSFLKNDWVITLILSSLLLLYISCQISLKIQQKKEF